MKFGQFSNSSTSYPKITPQIRIAPLRGASGIEIVIFGKPVDEFENCPNFIDTFWQFFQKISGPSAQAHLTFSNFLYPPSFSGPLLSQVKVLIKTRCTK